MQAAQRQSDAKSERVADFVRSLDVTSLDLWGSLDALSTHTLVEGVEVDPAGIVIGPGSSFTGVFNIYVTLQYGKDSDEGFSTSDSFLAHLSGHFEGDTPIVDSSSVDTSAFHGEAEG